MVVGVLLGAAGFAWLKLLGGTVVPMVLFALGLASFIFGAMFKRKR